MGTYAFEVSGVLPNYVGNIDSFVAKKCVINRRWHCEGEHIGEFFFPALLVDQWDVNEALAWIHVDPTALSAHSGSLLVGIFEVSQPSKSERTKEVRWEVT